jgi:hypothetical protein
MSTKERKPRAAALLRKRPTRNTRSPRPAIDHERPIPDIARTFAVNIVKRMWPSLYVQIATAPGDHTPQAHAEERSVAAP